MRPRAAQHGWRRGFRLRSTLVLCFAVALLIAGRERVQAEDPPSDNAHSDAVVRNTPSETPVASDLTVEGMASYGNWRIFASGRGFQLYTGGLEYDRHSWGYFLKARTDYVAEFLPLMILNSPTETKPWGQPTTTDRKLVPGIGICPIGFRLMWLPRKPVKPYFTAKGGIFTFSQKALNQNASYVNFSFQTAVGVYTRLNSRFDLRLGLFSDVHFSNAFIVPINPGLDVMNANLGLTYHLNRDRH